MSRVLKKDKPERDKMVVACFIEQKKLFPLYKWTAIIDIVSMKTGIGQENIKVILRQNKNLTQR